MNVYEVAGYPSARVLNTIKSQKPCRNEDLPPIVLAYLVKHYDLNKKECRQAYTGLVQSINDTEDLSPGLLWAIASAYMEYGYHLSENEV